MEREVTTGLGAQLRRRCFAAAGVRTADAAWRHRRKGAAHLVDAGHHLHC